MNLDELRKLAGINEFKGYTEYVLDENPSETAAARRKQEREMNIRPGDPEWFQLWFSKPFLTGPVQFRGRKKK